MSSIRNLLCAALAAGVLFSAPSAEARFGKHSDSSDSSDNKKSKTHNATAAKDDDDAPRRHGSGSSGASFLVDLLFSIFIDTRAVAPVAYVAPAEPVPSNQQVQSSAYQPSPTSVRLGVDGAAMNTAAGLGAFIGIEGIRAGIDARALGLVMPTDDGTAGVDNITLMNLHLTYALIAQEHARLRIEGGISSAHAPDLTAIGPSLGLSLEACVVGSLDLELRAQGTAYPFRQVDAQAGLALHLSSLVMRGGWRGIYLNDNGLVDDVVHTDTFGGPFLGLGFDF